MRWLQRCSGRKIERAGEMNDRADRACRVRRAVIVVISRCWDRRADRRDVVGTRDGMDVAERRNELQRHREQRERGNLRAEFGEDAHRGCDQPHQLRAKAGRGSPVRSRIINSRKPAVTAPSGNANSQNSVVGIK